MDLAAVWMMEIWMSVVWRTTTAMPAATIGGAVVAVDMAAQETTTADLEAEWATALAAVAWTAVAMAVGM